MTCRCYLILLVLVFELVIVSQTLILPTSAADTYYVATTGSDVTGDGSASNPWATIQYAIDQVSSGDTITIATGTYNESINIDKSLTVVSASGAPSTIIDAQGADFGILISGIGTVATIDGFTVRNYEVAGIVAGAFSLSEDDPTEVHILNNIVEEPLPEDSHNNCIQVGDGTTGTITGNEVRGAYLISEDWSGSGIIVAGSSDVLVTNNYVHNCEGGIQIVGYSEYRDAPAMNNIVENNKVEGCETGISIQMYSFNTVVRYNNVSNNDEGISVMASDYSWPEHSTPSGTGIHYNNIVDNIVGVVSSIWGDDTGTVPAETVNATLNWWGTTDPDLVAASTNGSIVFDPWLNPAHPDTVILNENSGFYYQTIQSAIDAASDYDIINVPAGVYNERITIEKPLTLRGATANVNKNGYTVPTNYVWDGSVETIINNPTPALEGSVVYIHDANDVTFEGFIVQKLNAVSGRNNENVLTVEADSMTMQNITLRNNVIGPNTNVAEYQDGTYGRMGLYINLNQYLETPYGLVGSTISGNKIFDCTGNGDNIFIWGAYYSYGARHPSPMEGTIIEDNEITGSHRTGIEIAGGCSGLTIQNNIISNNNGLSTDDPLKLKYGNGIVLIRGSSDSESSTGLGPESLTIVGNDIFGNEKNGIYLGPVSKNHNITRNNIHGNGWDGIRLDMEAHYYNPDFETVDRTALFNATENITTTYNNIYDNSELGVNVAGTPENGFVLNATFNWWGAASGPDDDAEIINGDGDKISEFVLADPWIADSYGLSMKEIVEPEGERYGSAPKLSNFGFEAAIHNLNNGWYRLNSGSWDVLFADMNLSEWTFDNWQLPDFVGLPEGVNTVFFKVDDVFGHESSLWSWEFFADKTGPVISDCAIVPGSGVLGTVFNITAVVVEPVDGVDSVFASIQKPDEKQVARVELTGGSEYFGVWDSTGFSEGTYYIDIIATDSLGNTVEKENSFHSPVLKIPVVNWTCCRVPANQTGYTLDAKKETAADILLNTTSGTPVVTVASCAPQNETGFTCKVDKYIDVNIEEPEAIESLAIRIYYTPQEVQGLDENDLRVYWWTGSMWRVCSDSGVNTTDFDGYGGYIWATITADSSPNLFDLSGTPFGANPVESPVGGTFDDPETGNGIKIFVRPFLVTGWLLLVLFSFVILGFFWIFGHKLRG